MADYPAIDLQFTDFHSPGGPDDSLQDRLHVALDEFGPLAIQEADTGDRWRVFFRTPQVRDAAAVAVRRIQDRSEHILQMQMGCPLAHGSSVSR